MTFPAVNVSASRSLAPRPQLLLLDEPFAALDAPTREQLLDQVRGLIAATGTPTILVTHDRGEALRLANVIVVLMNGVVRQVGDPETVFRAPADEEIADFVGVENVARGHVVSVADGVAHVRVGDHEFIGGTGVHESGDVLFCLRAEDIVLRPTGGDDGLASARNQVHARVVAVSPAGAFWRVELDAGIPLAALVTRDAVDDLALSPGSRVVAAFKAAAVHLIPR